MLTNFEVIIWDFDGVIIDSDEIRTNSFKETFKEFGKRNVDKLIEYHKLNGGLSRYDKIDFFFKKIINQNISNSEFISRVNLYSKFCLERLCDKSLLINDSLDFIKVNYKNYLFHIASASDEMELRNICKELDISHFFRSINGSPTTKVNNVKDILKNNNYSINNCCLIGDSNNDMDAANINGITFIGYNNQSLKANNIYIEKFNLHL
jgi:phosphoglycolate phosphatase-like HAD superfamily hydrolase